MTTGVQFSAGQSIDATTRARKSACCQDDLEHVNQLPMKSVKTFHFLIAKFPSLFI
ncbi:MAG: hypothetical protein JWM07_199 [Candidatus Saccharibacteria bacterium]|nr:hypothetical protein [Candidatus Saccharibacteria bacterium]